MLEITPPSLVYILLRVDKAKSRIAKYSCDNDPLKNTRLGQQDGLDGRGRFRECGGKNFQAYGVRQRIWPKRADRRLGLRLRAQTYPRQSPRVGKGQANPVRHLCTTIERTETDCGVEAGTSWGVCYVYHTRNQVILVHR